jgi:short-subunit dehydrogenase
MKRVTFAFSTYSGVGRQATSGTSAILCGSHMLGTMELDGTRVLLTGATGGLGVAIAQALADRGAKLVLSGQRTDALAALADELGAEALACDLADRRQLDTLVGQAGEVDVLVANAGLPGGGTLLKVTQAEIDRVLEVNLRAPIALAHALALGMADRKRGHMVFIASVAGKVPSAAESSIYTATKFGLRGFAHVSRAQLRRKGIGVSLVTPGPVRDAGMFARGGGKTPPFISPSSPEDVGKAVVRAIEQNAAEIDVASLGLRLIAKVGALAPATIAGRSAR